MNRLENKVAVITGAAQGIGATYARAFAEEGAKVVVSDIHDPSGVVAEITEKGGSAIGVIADVTDNRALADLVDAAESNFGPIEILVNNAAFFAGLRVTPFMDISEDEWDRVMTVNVRGTFQCTKAVVPSMRKNGRGKIINVSTGLFFSGGPGLSHYVSSKGAVLAFTRSISRELGEENITVNCVTPGLTESENVRNHPDFGGAREATPPSRAFKRVMVPEDMVGAVLFLATEDSDFLTGQTLNVDGGKINY